MKANELMIGNWIVDSNRTQKSVTPGILLNWESLETKFGQYLPIPLTEQWLLDFGFKKIDNKYFKVGFQLKGTKVADDIGYHFGRHDFSIEITHVHQLQNLYFALTGEELKIKADSNEQK